MSTEYRIASPHLAQFVQAIWRQAGSTAREAELVADHLVQANLVGHDSHGVGMIPSYMASLAQGQLQLNQHADVVRVAARADARRCARLRSGGGQRSDGAGH